MVEVCYYLRHGLWSIIAGLLHDDEPINPQERTLVEKLLWHAAADPCIKSFSSRIVRCPWHQSWLAAVLIQNMKLFASDRNIVTASEVEVMKKETEFQCILYNLPHSESCSSILEELLHLYGQVVRADRVKCPVQSLSEDAHNFLCGSLLIDPVTTNAVIQHLLCVWCPHFLHTDNELQNIYMEALELCVQELESRSSGMDTNRSNAFCASVPNTSRMCEWSTGDLCNTLLCILAVLEVSEEKEKELVERFCPRLLDLCESGLFSRRLLFLGVTSRRKLKLTTLLMDLEDDRYKRQSNVNDALVMEGICGNLVDLFGNIQVEEVYLCVVKQNRHWIEDIVDVCGHLLMCGDTEVVKKLLSHHTMSRLWPLVLLHVWKNFSDRDEIFAVVSFVIEQCKRLVIDPVFTSLCSVADHQMSVVQWCKKHGHRYSFTNRDLLELTREYSTLEVLRRTASMEDLQLNEARSLLLQSNEQGYLNTNKVPGRKYETEGTSWEVTTFDGFCVLKKVFSVIQSSMEIEQLRKKIYRYVSRTSESDVLLKSVIPGMPAYFLHDCTSVILHNASIETEESSLSQIAIEAQYNNRVTQQLQEIRTMLCTLFPLNFRVEILENIFSLLFLRYDDVHEETSSDSGANDDEGDCSSRVPKSEIVSKCTDSTAYKNLGDTEVTHNMISFQQVCDVSSSLRTMPVIEAHISGSPPLEPSGVSPGEPLHQPCLPRQDDMSITDSESPLEATDMSSISKMSGGSPVNVSSQAGSREKCSSPLIATFDKLSSSLSGAVTASLCTSAEHSSLPSRYSMTNVVTAKSAQTVSLSLDVTSDFSKLPACLDVNQSSKPRQHKKSTKSNHSENTSVRSGASGMTVTGGHQEFICTQDLIRDLLHCLKECLVETSAALYSSLTMDKVDVRKIKVSSIQPEFLQQHMNRLSVCVNEALWRLQLFTDTEFMQKIGHISMPGHISAVCDTQDDWLYQSEASESEDEEKAGVSAAHKPAGKRSKPEAEKSSESGSQSTRSGGGAVTSASSNHKVRWSKSKLRHISLVPLPTGIINLMSSSLSSLAVRCLTRGELSKAKQVTKMFEEKDNPLDLEVKFIEAYQSLLKRLRTCVESRQSNTEQVVSTSSGRKISTMESIKRAASAGMQSASLTNQMETFLSITCIPGIPGADTIISEFPHEAAMLQGVDNNIAMAALDVALTVGATYEHSASLLDVACKHCDILHEGSSSTDTSGTKCRTRNVIPGYIQFTKNVIKLLKEANRSQPESSIFPLSVSLSDLISSGCLPLSLRAMKDYIAFWNSLHEAAVELQATLDSADNRKIQSGSVSPSTSNASEDGSGVKPHIAFRTLSEICTGQPGSGRSGGNYMYYLQQVHTYLKLVTSLLQQNLPPETAHLTTLARPVNYFDVFNSSLIVLLGQLVFEYHIPPSHLEPVARKLNLNLVYNIVCNCCPKIPSLLPNIAPNFGNGCGKNWGKIVLNNSRQWYGPVRHPEVAVRSLLADVLHVIQEQIGNFAPTNINILNQQHICALAENPVLKTVLADTSELTVIDVDMVVPGDETLTFYTNLANLMWLHSLFILETSPPLSSALSDPFRRLKDCSTIRTNCCDQHWTTKFGLLSSNALERQVVHMSVGYNIGKLGFLSLHDVYKQLLGDLALPSASSLQTCAVLRGMPRAGTFLLESTSIDPRVLFVLLNGRKQSPKIQVLFCENLDIQLDSSMTEFLNCNVKCDSNCQRLVIPELLHLYQDYVQLNQEPESHTDVGAFSNMKSPQHASLEEDDDYISTVYSRERLSQLVDFLRDNTSGQLQIEVTKFADALSESQTETAGEMNIRLNLTEHSHDSCGTVVKIEKPTNEFGILLDYNRFEGSTSDTASTPNGKCDVSEETWKYRVVQDPVLMFLERHCWLLSALVQKVHQDDPIQTSPVHGTLSHKMTGEQTRCLEQLFRSKWVGALKPIFQNNLIITALHSEPRMEELWCLLDCLVKKQDWQQCAEILWALPETKLLNDPKLQTFHDVVMYRQASKSPTEGSVSPWWYCQRITDVSLQEKCLLHHLHHWPGHGCQDALKAVLGHYHQKLPTELTSQLQEMLHKISVCEKILPFADSAGLKTWYDVSSMSEENPSLILELLMETKEVGTQFQICLEWAKLHDIATRAQHLIHCKFLLLFLEQESPDFLSAAKLLESLPVQQSVAICNELIEQLKSVVCLKFVITFLLNSCSSNLSSKQLGEYQNLSIGIQMLAVLPHVEQTEHWDLIGRPHLIVEQFIMNTRFEVLEKMISEVHPLLTQLPAASPMSLTSIDSVLRHYASKALDFRVVQRSAPCRVVPGDEKLLVSLSVGSTHSEEFVMPALVPSKDEWVPNDEVTGCMCCQSVAFSMFNRRHHCRRCGRVICGSCSTLRTKVVGYGSVAVRVCGDCYQQMKTNCEQMVSPMPYDNQPPLSLNVEDSLNSKLTWKLTSDEAHNTALRQEFSFEHAPSVPLCLAILKLHSEHVAYPRFLLDACDRMLQLLQPVGPGTANPEVDYSLVIRMVRSLVVAAKVKHARSGLNTGVAHCDELLSQVDLLNMLVNSGCSALIPAEPLNGHALRHLRDRLVEEELWLLAMEVSTKSGLERTGVWAAWGKSCLRAGCWKEAREKFSHCLEKVSPGLDAARPPRSPPLLNEIIQILQEGAYTVDHKVLQQANKARSSRGLPAALLSSPAVTVLHTLSSLNEITHGNYPQTMPPFNAVVIGPKLDPIFYEECQYYLSSYGSHAAIINFYLSHDDLLAALKHVLVQKVDPEIFLETIYIPCLRQGLVSDLLEQLSTVDPTLEVWKGYLCHVCHYLEKQGLLNVLYQLQVHLHDYVRAAMTCIRFYLKGARNYSDLASNLQHLRVAQKHLEIELRTAHQGTSSRASSAQRRESTLQFAMRLDPREVKHHLSTIFWQMEVTKFLHSCELERHHVMDLIPELLQPLQSSGIIGTKISSRSVPTLFDSNVERMQLAVLVVLCGKTVDEGFGLAFRIIADYHLKASQIYSLVGRKLALDGRLADIEQLISCIQRSGVSETNSMCDDVLVLCVQVLAEKQDSADMEPLIKLIVDPGRKISAYIKCRQLKSAYLLAVKYGRLDDVQKILHEAQKLGQTKIQQICLKRLGLQVET